MKHSDVIRAFQEVRLEFPFPGYMDMDDKLSKYLIIISWIMTKVPPKSKVKVLSIGSGPCDLEAILSKMGYDVTAIDDLNDHWHLIGKNRERIKDFAKQMNIKLIVEPAGLPQITENSFDVVLLIDVIEHLHNSPRELLNYVISSLKPNGLLLIETPNAVSLAKRLKVLLGKSNQVNVNYWYWTIGEYRSHTREYTRSELRRILLYHRLTAINARMVDITFIDIKSRGLLQKIILKIYKLISSLYPNFGDTILISGEKPKNWQPTTSSITNFKQYYTHMKKWNLDNEPDEVIIKKFLKPKNPHSAPPNGVNENF